MAFQRLLQHDISVLLSSISPEGLALALAVSAVAAYLIFSTFRTPVDIPGPMISRMTSLYRIWAFGRGYAAVNALGLHRKYGDVVRTGPHHIIITNAEGLSQVYGTNLSKVCY